MKKFLTEFKEFAMKGNVLDLAVGMMIGSAFGKIVSSLVNDIFMPVISALFSIGDFTSLKICLRADATDEALNVYLNYGQFIQNVVDFLIIALCIFLFVKVINTMKNKLSKSKEEEPAKESVKSDELKALEEIVELLKNK